MHLLLYCLASGIRIWLLKDSFFGTSVINCPWGETMGHALVKFPERLIVYNVAKNKCNDF